MKTFENVIAQIKKGGFPSVTGLYFTQSQINEIETLLEGRKSEITTYFNSTIKPRLAKTQTL